MVQACQNFVKWNLEWVWAEGGSGEGVDAELGELEGETLVQLLQQSDVVLHNEITLYQLVYTVFFIYFLFLFIETSV